MEEVWKDIIGYEGLYQISNFGRVKSLPKYITNGCYRDELILKYWFSKKYYAVYLVKNKIRKCHVIHQLVWDAFGDKPRNSRKLQVDHKDNNKLNNRIDNLQLLTQRNNLIKYCKNMNGKSSKFLGVSYTDNTSSKKWRSKIRVKDKVYALGFFNTQAEASLAYQKALISYGLFSPDMFKIKPIGIE